MSGLDKTGLPFWEEGGGVRARRPCICPHGTRNTQDYGRITVRESATPGCLEHDACHGWTRERRAARRAAMPWSDPWCPVHETKDCP
jgi:hypothetical protein